MTICFLAWHAPSIAAGLLAGSPSLHAGHVAGAALQTGGALMLAAGARAAPAAAKAGAGGRVGDTLQAASSLKTGASIGASRAADAGAGPVGQAMGAIGGAAKVMLSPLARAADVLRKRVSDGELAALNVHGVVPATDRVASSSNTSSPAADGDAVSPSGAPAPSAASSTTQASTRAAAGSTSSTQALANTLNCPVGADPRAVTTPTSPSVVSASPVREAARIHPGQRRIDDTATDGLRPNLGASLHRDAAAREGATDATQRAADAANPDLDASTESASRVDEPVPSTTPDASSIKE